MKKTLVLGATPNPSRYAYQATLRLRAAGHPVELVGIKAGEIAGVPIHTDRPTPADIDTVTLYVGPANQPEWYDYVLGLKPRRIIFNPGTENEELEQKASQQGIETLEACTLVLLATGSY